MRYAGKLHRDLCIFPLQKCSLHTDRISMDNLSNRTPLISPSLLLLYRLLTAFAYRHPAVGYMQSLNFLAALILAVSGTEHEELAFWCLCGIAGGVLAAHYSPGVGSLLTLMQAFKAWLADCDPALAGLLLERGVDISFRAISWVLCLFFTYIPPSLAIVVWDVALTTGAWAHWQENARNGKNGHSGESANSHLKIRVAIDIPRASSHVHRDTTLHLRDIPLTSQSHYNGVIVSLFHATRALLTVIAPRLERCEPYSLTATDLIQTAGMYIGHPRSFTDQLAVDAAIGAADGMSPDAVPVDAVSADVGVGKEGEKCQISAVVGLQTEENGSAEYPMGNRSDYLVPSFSRCLQFLPVFLANAQLKQAQEESLRAQQAQVRQAKRRGEKVPHEAVIERLLRGGELADAEEQARVVDMGAKLRSAKKIRNLQHQLANMHALTQSDSSPPSKIKARYLRGQEKSAPAAVFRSPLSPRRKSTAILSSPGSPTSRRRSTHSVLTSTHTALASPSSPQRYKLRTSVGKSLRSLLADTYMAAINEEHILESRSHSEHNEHDSAAVGVASSTSAPPAAPMSSAVATQPTNTLNSAENSVVDVNQQQMAPHELDAIAGMSPFVTRRRPVARKKACAEDKGTQLIEHLLSSDSAMSGDTGFSAVTHEAAQGKESQPQMTMLDGPSVKHPAVSPPYDSVKGTGEMEDKLCERERTENPPELQTTRINDCSGWDPSSQKQQQQASPRTMRALAEFARAHYYDDVKMLSITLDPVPSLEAAAKTHTKKKRSKSEKTKARPPQKEVVDSSRPKASIEARRKHAKSKRKNVLPADLEEPDDWFEYLNGHQPDAVNMDVPRVLDPSQQKWSTRSTCSNESTHSLELQRMGGSYRVGVRDSLYIPEGITRIHEYAHTLDVKSRSVGEKRQSLWRRLWNRSSLSTNVTTSDADEAQQMFIAGIGVNVIEHYSAPH